MKKSLAVILMLFVTAIAAAPRLAAQDADEPLAPQDSSCVKCHGESEIWDADKRRFFITEEHLANDIHWQKGIHCHDCHGGDPESLNFRTAHSSEAGYRVIESPQDIPKFCGHCHSNVDTMSHYRPSPKTNQEADYWTSGHGQRLKESPDAKVATCVSCHGNHGIRAVNDLESPTYPTNVAKTCATCHSDAQKMAGIQYHGRPIGHDQFDQWKTSVHAELLLNKGDLSAPTCNDCHGNHGAVAPDVTSVASACATCHVKIGALFDKTVMKHRFEEAKLPGCAACHGNHAIYLPTDEMLGMGQGAVCATCHAGGKFGATLAGANEAKTMREGLEQLKQLIATAEGKVDHAEQLGMEVSQAKFRLRDARDSLSNARAEIHSFAAAPLKKILDQGVSVTHEVDDQAEAALREYSFRRVWLGLSLLPIALVVVLLVLYIRTLPPPTVHDSAH